MGRLVKALSTSYVTRVHPANTLIWRIDILHLEDLDALRAHKRGVCYLGVSMKMPDAQAFMFRRKLSPVAVMFRFFAPLTPQS